MTTDTVDTEVTRVKLEKIGKIKVETELVDLSYRRIQVDKTKLVIVEFQLKRAIAPEEAGDIAALTAEFIKTFVRPKENEVVAISGRGPIYLYLIIQHKIAHLVTMFGQYDPKINGVILTAVHYAEGYREGQVVKLPEELKAELPQT